MTALHLAEFSVGQLVEAFRDASFGLADEVDNENAHRRFDDRLQQLKEELRRRGPDARRALLPLLECAETGPVWLRRARAAECRYRVACELLALEPQRARAALEALAQGWPEYQRFEARGALEALDHGTFKPT